MKNSNFIFEEIKRKKSMLCVGLDPDISKLHSSYTQSDKPLQKFCTDIIDWTHPYAIAYKLNVAFFEAHGPKGWEQLQSVIRLIPEECLIILDAKRADIGNTSKQYADYYYNELKVDAVTLHPYMGLDSIEPFMTYDNKWAIVLALTSNRGSEDIELVTLQTGEKVFEHVLNLYSRAYSPEKMMFVCGATQPKYFQIIRNICPNHFLLVPGIGTQGGDLKNTIQSGMNKMGGLLINISRDILYGPGDQDPRKYTTEKAKYFQHTMFELLQL